jgi:hypothetical protein
MSPDHVPIATYGSRHDGDPPTTEKIDQDDPFDLLEALGQRKKDFRHQAL